MSLISDRTADPSTLLVQGIYRSLIDGASGVETLAAIKGKSGAHCAFYLGMQDDLETANALARGVDRSVLVEPAFLESLSTFATGLASGGMTEIDLRSVDATPQEHLATALGCDGTLLLLCIDKERQRCLLLGVLLIGRRASDVEKARELLMTLAPHLQTALDIQRRLSGERDRADRFESLFEHSPVARVVVDHELMMTEHNSAFERLISGHRAPISATDGYLTIANPEFRSEVHRLVDNATQHAPTANITWIRDSDVSLGWLLRVDALGGRLLKSYPFLQLDKLSNPKYMLSFYEVGNQSGLSSALLGAVFGLSAAESELAYELAKGSAPAEIAQRRGVAKNTVHNQLTSIMSRNGLHRQGQLINLLSTLPFFL